MIPFLRSSLRTLIDGQNFSFSEFWRAKPTNLPDALDYDLLDWVAGVFFQFRDMNSPAGAKTAGHGWPLQHPGAFARLITCSKGMRNRWAAFGVMPNQQPSRKTRWGT